MQDTLSIPDDVLLRILSILSTKEATRTSVVSKEWQKMVNSLPFLCFDDGYSPERAKKVAGFVNFVDRVLSNHKGDVYKFSMKCGRYVDSNRLGEWIKYAIFHGVRELDLVYYNFDGLPPDVATCKTLEVLRMHIDYIHLPVEICLPNLKTLDLCVVQCTHITIQRLISSCIKLEELKLKGCTLSEKICSPNLKTLHLDGLSIWDNTLFRGLISSCTKLEELEITECTFDQNCSFSTPSLKRLNIGCFRGPIHIDAPNLVYFRCCLFEENISVKNLNSLLEAYIDIQCRPSLNHSDTATISLFKAINNVKSLHISGRFEEFFHVDGLMPKLSKLTYLTLEGKGIWERWISVLPQCFRYVEALDFNVKIRKDDQVVEIPPHCSWPQLKKLNILSFKNTLSEVLMIKCLLKKAVSLEKLTVQVKDRRRISATRRKLLSFEKASNKCRIIVL